MAKKALGSVKHVNEVLITSADLATDVTGILGVANGGTGQSVFTDGQLLIGNTTGNTLAKATLTAGANIGVTNGAGAITLALDDGGAFGYNAKVYGAVGDAVRLGDGAITSGLTTFTSASAGFVAADVGKTIFIAGAGAAGVPLLTTISGFTNSTTVTIANAASTTVSGAETVFGTLNNTPFANAIAALPNNGGFVIVPPGRYLITSTITLGNGAQAGQSTKQNIGFRGSGSGFTESEMSAVVGATEILWCGAANGVMMSVEGPISSVRVSDLWFDCSPLGATVTGANTGLKTKHVIHSRVERITVRRFSGAAFDLGSYSDPVGVAIGANENTWIDLAASGGIGSGAIGLRVGESTRGNTPFLGISKNTFINCVMNPGTSAGRIGIELRFADNLLFLGAHTVANIGLQVTVPSGTNGFPGSITFAHCALQGSTAVTGTWTPNERITFLYYSIGDGEVIPTHAGFSGFTSENQWFGTWHNKTLVAKTAATNPLILKGAASQTADLLLLKNDADATLSRFTSDGRLLLADGGSSAVSIGRTAGDNTGFYMGANFMVFTASGTPKYYFEDFGDRGFILSNDMQLSWANHDNAVAVAPDTGLLRAAPGVTGFNDGTAAAGGTYRAVARTPAQITANQNNYNPGGTSYFQRWSTDASRNITGMTFTTAQVDGQRHRVVNVGSFPIVLQHENASSTAANRFTNSTMTDIIVNAGQSVDMVYSATTSRWLVFLGAVGPRIARVTSQFDKTSNTTFSDVTGLSHLVAAGRTYSFEAILFTSSGTSGGVKFTLGGTATATAIRYEGLLFDQAGLTEPTQTRASALGTTVCGVTAVTVAFVRIYGTITVNAAGTLTVQFAQNASNGTTSSVLTLSTFSLVPVDL